MQQPQPLPRFINKEVGVLADAYHHDEICGPVQSSTVVHWNNYYATRGREEFLKMIKRCIAARMRAFDKAALQRMTHLKNIINSAVYVSLTPQPQVQIDGVDYTLPNLTDMPLSKNDYISDLDHLQFIYLLRRLYLLVFYAVTDGQVCQFTLTEPAQVRGASLVTTFGAYNPGTDMIPWKWSVHKELSLYFNTRFATVQRQDHASLQTKFDIYDQTSDHVVDSIGEGIARRCEIVYEDPEDVYIGPFGILNRTIIDHLNASAGSSHVKAYFWSSFMSLRFGLFTNDTWRTLLSNIESSTIPLANRSKPCFIKDIDETHIGHTLPAYATETLALQIQSRVCNYILVKMLRALILDLQRVRRFVAIILDLFNKDEGNQLPTNLLPLVPHFVNFQMPNPNLQQLLGTAAGATGAGAGGGAGHILNVLYEYFTDTQMNYIIDLKQEILNHLSFASGVSQDELKSGKPTEDGFKQYFLSLILHMNGSGLKGVCPSDLIDAQVDDVVRILSDIGDIQQTTIDVSKRIHFSDKYNFNLKRNLFNPQNPDLKYEGILWSRNRRGGITETIEVHTTRNKQRTREVFKRVFGLLLDDPSTVTWIPYDGYA